MRKVSILWLSVLMLAFASQAQASYIMDFTSLGGTDLGTINSTSFTGTSTVVQHLGSDGVLTSGDPFSQTNTSLFSAGYTNTSLTYIVPLPNNQMLTIVAPALSGALTTASGTNFNYLYNTPTTGINIYYSNGSISNLLIATVTLTNPSGGINNDGFNTGTQFTTGTFHLTASFTYLYPGIFETADGTDMATLLAEGYAIIAGMSGHIDFSNEVFTPDPTDPTVSSFINIGGDLVVEATPEPGTMLLMGVGILGMAFVRKRFQRNC
jgi:hypothetical protein